LEDLAEIREGRIAAAVGGRPDERRHAAVVVISGLRAVAQDAQARRDGRLQVENGHVRTDEA
jgi:hypothetical protein